MNETKSTEVDVRGGRLPVWTQAGEPTTLVFLHLWGGSHRTFAPVIDRLLRDAPWCPTTTAAGGRPATFRVRTESMS
jgi:pimeloyl-ACP methyl ester carboxylesterase